MLVIKNLLKQAGVYIRACKYRHTRLALYVGVSTQVHISRLMSLHAHNGHTLDYDNRRVMSLLWGIFFL
jgi:hypothetical protein